MLYRVERFCAVVLVCMLMGRSVASVEVKPKELLPIVANVSIWDSNATAFSNKFPEWDWEDVEHGREYRAKGLTLWGESVAAVRLSETTGVVTLLEFEILSQDSTMMMPLAKFNKRAVFWKSLLDKKFKKKGKLMPSLSMGAMKLSRVAWQTPKSIVILTSHVGARPDRLVLSIYETKHGLAALKRKGQQKPVVTEPEPKDVSKEEPILTKERAEIRKKIREISSRKPPKGISRKVQDAVNLLNVYRYLSGVPYDVKADKRMIAAAEDAASICKKNGKLSHGFGHSTDKCNLAMNSANLTNESSVTQYMEDSGANNRERRGHRRWCLNHRMGKTGFGLDGDYSAMYSMDNSGRGIRKNYSYPGHGYYPIKYLHGNGWSYYLVNGNAPSKCEVQVWRLRKKDDRLPAWSKTPNGVALPVKYVNIYANSIIFEPQDEPVTKKGYYLVRIKGKGLKEQYLVKLY